MFCSGLEARAFVDFKTKVVVGSYLANLTKVDYFYQNGSYEVFDEGCSLLTKNHLLGSKTSLICAS